MIVPMAALRRLPIWLFDALAARKHTTVRAESDQGEYEDDKDRRDYWINVPWHRVLRAVQGQRLILYYASKCAAIPARPRKRDHVTDQSDARIADNFATDWGILVTTGGARVSGFA